MNTILHYNLLPAILILFISRLFALNGLLFRMLYFSFYIRQRLILIFYMVFYLIQDTQFLYNLTKLMTSNTYAKI